MRFVSSCNIAAALYVVDQFAAYEFVVGKNKGFRVDFVAKRLKKKLSLLDDDLFTVMLYVKGCMTKGIHDDDDVESEGIVVFEEGVFEDAADTELARPSNTARCAGC